MPFAKEQIEFQQAVSSKISEFIGDPPVVSQIQELPLNKLTWENFEILCCRLVLQESNVQGTPYRYGIQGNTQLGIDIVANVQADNAQKTWCYQCKRYKDFTLSDLRTAISSLSYTADHFVICISTRATTDMRDEVKNYGKSIEIWDAEDISTKLKLKEEIVEDFFGKEWKNRFCITAVSSQALGYISGRVFDSEGHNLQEADIRIIVNGRTHSSAKTDLNGAFRVGVFAQTPTIGIIAEKSMGSGKLCLAKQMSWQRATEDEVFLSVREEKVINGRIVECGTGIAINDVAVRVTFLDEIISYQKSLDGTFNLRVPAHEALESYSLSVNADGFIESNMEITGSQRVFNFTLVKNCIPKVSERLLTVTVCDGLRIELLSIPEGEYYKGDPDNPTKVSTPSYYISRFPITCLQYSFYAQYEKLLQLPLGWKSRQPPENSEKLPVSGISWDEAKAFSEWLTHMTDCDFGLPSEDQWEKAARGVEEPRQFPWGNDTSNFIDRCNSVDNGIGRVMSYDAFPLGRSAFGVWDMSGNLWEWTGTEHTTDIFYLKGGSYNERYEEIQCHSRTFSNRATQRPFYGFRIVMKGII